MLLYDADRITRRRGTTDDELVDAQRDMILDPLDPEVIAAAQANGIHDAVIESAQRSPVYKFVKEWGLALPLHLEFRTLPMLFYVPPLLARHGARTATTRRRARASSPRSRRRGCRSSTWRASSPPGNEEVVKAPTAS